MNEEKIDHPPHYGGADDPFECIKVLEAWLTPEQLAGFLIGNLVKYVNRHGKKGVAVEDLKKARWYLDRLINRMETKTNG